MIKKSIGNMAYTHKFTPHPAGQWSRRLKTGQVRGPWMEPTKIGEDGATLCHTIFQLLLLPWSQLIFFCPAVGNKRKTLTVCYPHLFGGLQFSFASFCPLLLFFIYFFGSPGPWPCPAN